MQPDAVAAFAKGFHEEVNGSRAEAEGSLQSLRREVVLLDKSIDGLFTAVAEGTLRGAAVGDRLETMQARKAAIEKQLAGATVSQPRFHPALAEMYKAEVDKLQHALNAPGARDDAADRLRRLIDHVTVRTDNDGQYVELYGDILTLLTLPGGKVPDPFKSSVQMVAGVIFHSVFTSCSSYQRISLARWPSNN